MKGLMAPWLFACGRIGIAAVLLSIGSICAQAQSVAPLAIQPSAAQQIAVLNDIKTSKSATESKLDSGLLMAVLKQRGDSRTQQLPDYRYVRPEADGRIAVDLIVKTTDGVGAVLERLKALDAVTLTDKRVAYDSRTVRARVRMGDLERLAAMGQVSRVGRAIPAVTNAVPAAKGPTLKKPSKKTSRDSFGPVANALNRSQGVQAHGADAARASFGASGLGVKICVMSDGVDSLATAQSSGDLPEVDVLPGRAGEGDEGTAMLEIVHDVAPMAALGFATALDSPAEFAQNILDLAADGCNIIVDDIIYLNESPFQDGPIAQAVNTVTGNGVLYFSSAGNEGNLSDGTSGTWEGNFLASTLANPGPLAGAGALHNFGDGGQSIGVVSGSDRLILIWAEHFPATGGSASTDFDIYVLNGALTTVFETSNDRQNGTGGDDFPIEFIGGGAFPGERVVVARFASGTTTSVPAFNLILFRGRLSQALATSGATRGHSVAAAAFSTAATPAAASADGFSTPGPFPGQFTSVNTSESFSSDGPRRILLSPTGAELTPGNRTFSGGVLRQKPDIAAADGVTTSAPGFAPFYGTSASAPHAAAIAGLLKSAVAGLTQAQVRNLLTSTAIDIETVGVDRTTGAGIVMPVPALQAAGATPQPQLSAGTAVFTQVSGDGDSSIEPTETFSISLPLTNVGPAAATAISATLSSSSGLVTILNAHSSYANLAPSASGSNTTAFTFRVEPAFLCGGTINFSLRASYSGTFSPQMFPFSTGTGGPGTPASFSFTGPVVAIPDFPGASVNANLAVSGVTGPITDVNLRIGGSSCNTDTGSTTVGIDHTFVGDLQVRVVSPSGQVIGVVNQAGGGGQNLCQTLLDDESAGPNIQTVTVSGAPFTGSFKPAAPLSGFDGSTANGTWALQVQDLEFLDIGSVRAFSLTVTGAGACDAAPPPGPTVLTVVRANPSPTNAASVTYTVTFSEAVSGVGVADFSLTNAGLSGASVTGVSGSGAVRTVSVNTGTGSGTLRLNVVDDDSIVSVSGGSRPLGGAGAGNGTFTTGEVYSVDKLAPTATIAIASGQANPTTASPVLFAVQFNESTVQFTAADVILSGTAGANTAVVSGSGSAYTVSVSGMTVAGTVSAGVTAAAILDAAGNPNAASATATVNFQVTPPPPAGNCEGTPVTNACTVNGVANRPCLGTSGNDTIVGSTSGDVIQGGLGIDTIDGRAGVDRICGGDGNDMLKGGDGNDVMFGGIGNDRVDGGKGGDQLNGNDGNDTLIGGPGGDNCRGDAGTDTATTCETRSGIP
ncbi:MAG: S8 family serine peptidase [Panacagrimonas sp.]